MNYREQYESGEPFPHLVIDDYFDKDLVERAAAEFPSNENWRVNEWHRPQPGSVHERKFSNVSNVLNVAPESIREILKTFNSPEFISFITEVTGVDNLVGDNLFQGGGIHQIPRGGHLGVHLDFTRHKRDKSYFRRANILLYMNKDWMDEYGGHLELWNASKFKGGEMVKKISPILGRMVIFGTSRESWHGHPEPLSCPEGVYRNSLAAYYYSKDPSNDLEVRGTVFGDEQ